MDGFRYRSYKRNVVKIKVTRKLCSGSLDELVSLINFFSIIFRERDVFKIDRKDKIANNDVLQYALENGMIDLAYVREQIEMNKRKEVLEKHPYSIWEGKDGKWYTYLPDEEKSRRKALKKRKTKKEIEDLVISYWKKQTVLNRRYSFEDAYYMWRKIKDQLVSDNTVAKYETDYKRFFKGTNFAETDIKKISSNDVMIFMVQTIKRLRLQKETSRKLFGYITNTVFYARKELGLESNPVEFIKAKDFYSYCTEKYTPVEKKIIVRDDMKLLQRQFVEDHEVKPNYIPTYAVEFASLTGMRVGEIAALRWDAIKDDYIVIDKSEKSNRKKDTFYIDNTKNSKIRFFPLTDEIKKLLHKIQMVEKEYGYLCEWVFANENGRIHAKTISSCIKTKCRQVGIDEKGIHAFRKTLNSNMRCRGVSSTVAASILGHSRMVNEQYYTFDVTDMLEKAKIVEEINVDTCAM